MGDDEGELGEGFAVGEVVDAGDGDDHGALGGGEDVERFDGVEGAELVVEFEHDGWHFASDEGEALRFEAEALDDEVADLGFGGGNWGALVEVFCRFGHRICIVEVGAPVARYERHLGSILTILGVKIG